MKNNKGISMISLIVTIICILIFIGLSYRLGSRYVKESKEEEKSSLVMVISNAVVRRQNDKFISVGNKDVFYSGYQMTEEDFNKFIDTDKHEWGNGLWFVIDAKSAEDLGIVNPEQYLVSDLTDPKSADDDKYIAIVDYDTGEVELVYYDGDIAKEDLDELVKGDGSGCTHQFTVATCIEPSVCTKCGKIGHDALGHSFNDDRVACTEDKKCSRCGYIAEKAIGHEYTSELSWSDEGHFNKCKRYHGCSGDNGEVKSSACYGIGNFNEHIKQYGYITGEAWKHNVHCTFDDCGWEAIEECTKSIKSKDLTYHTIYCKDCGRSEDVEHDDIRYRYIDKNKHVVYCNTCKSDLYTEEHVDIEKPFGVCDKCGGTINMNNEPEIELLTMENITVDVTNKYYAKNGDTIKVILKASAVLAEAPTVKIQNQKINANEISTDDNLNWYVEFNTADYSFSQGKMNIEVSNVKSIYGVSMSGSVTETTDKNYIIYDAVKPEYIYLP